MESCYIKNIKYDRKALTEVYEITNLYTNTRKRMIPKIIIDIIKDNRDSSYKFDVTKLEETELMVDTKKILTYLYTNFLSNQLEREKIKEAEKIQYEEMKNQEYKNELKKRELYNVDEIFKNTEKIVAEQKDLIKVTEEKWYKKFLNFLLSKLRL